MKFRILTICVYILMLFLCLFEINYLINFPQQHQLHAAEILSNGRKTIRELEKNSQGVNFRWMSDTVTLTIPQTTPMGVLTLHYWIAPNRKTTEVQINTSTYTLPPTEALKQRRIAMLVLNHDAIPQTTISIHFVTQPNQPIAWAFTDADWQRLSPIPHLSIWGSIGLIWVLCALTIQRIGRQHWLSITSTSILLMTISAAQTNFSTSISSLLLDEQLLHHSALIAVGWCLWYILHPRVMRFLTTATYVQRLAIGSYLLFTTLPPIGMIFNPEPESIAVKEQRQKQDCPTQWIGNLWDVGQNFPVLAQCISDTIGWRSFMIRSKNELDYRLFGVSSRVYFGNNDFYFLRRWGDERFPKLTEIVHDPVQYTQLRLLLQEINATYAANNIHMILVIAPSKDILYPENLPWYAPRYDPQMVVNLEDELRDSGVDVIPVTKILQQHKHDVPLLYHQRDFHWNEIAAYYVAQEIVARIAFGEHRSSPWPKAPPVFHPIWKDPTDQHFAALLLNRDVSPRSYGIATARPRQTAWLDESYANQEFGVWRAQSELDQPPLPNLAILGDSFSGYFRNVGMEWYFQTILMSRPIDSPTIIRTFQLNAVKYVVVQVRDVSLPLLLTHQNEQ